MISSIEETPAVWVLDWEISSTTIELLGDARVVADALDATVGALVVASNADDAARLINHGADLVRVATPRCCAGVATRLRESLSLFEQRAPRLVLLSGTAYGREWASLLASSKGWRLVSPALHVRSRSEGLEVVGLDNSGKLSRNLLVPSRETVVATLRPGVGQSLPPQTERHGFVEQVVVDPASEAVECVERIEANPELVDIRDAPRLIAGGQGLGGREGFDVLRRFAKRLHAGVAASRVAVDLGWIKHDQRQVGQTGKTVKPDLYMACGISGASHHLEGMSDAKHIVAINTDPTAPIFKLAHLGLAADFRATIDALETLLSRQGCD